MLRKIWIVTVLLSICLVPAMVSAEVDWEIVKILNLPAEPLDAFTSPGGRYIYVLTNAGQVIVYDANGNQKDAISVGKEIKALKAGVGDENILLLSPGNRQIQMAALSFVYDIPTVGDPVLGNPEAPVTVVVFSDFQCPYCARLVPLLKQVWRTISG